MLFQRAAGTSSPDLADECGLPAVRGGQPVEHPFVRSQLPHHPVAPGLQNRLEGCRCRPPPVLRCHCRHQGLEGRGGTRTLVPTLKKHCAQCCNRPTRNRHFPEQGLKAERAHQQRAALALHCTALYCTFTGLHCTVPYCTALYRAVLHCIGLYHTVPAQRGRRSRRHVQTIRGPGTGPALCCCSSWPRSS